MKNCHNWPTKRAFFATLPKRSEKGVMACDFLPVAMFYLDFDFGVKPYDDDDDDDDDDNDDKEKEEEDRGNEF